MKRTLHFRVEVEDEDVKMFWDSIEAFKFYMEEMIAEDLNCHDVKGNVVGRIEKV